MGESVAEALGGICAGQELGDYGFDDDFFDMDADTEMPPTRYSSKRPGEELLEVEADMRIREFGPAAAAVAASAASSASAQHVIDMASSEASKIAAMPVAKSIATSAKPVPGVKVKDKGVKAKPGAGTGKGRGGKEGSDKDSDL